MLAMAVGGLGWQSALKPFIAPIVSLIAVECTSLLEFNANDDPVGMLKSMGIPLGRALLGLVPTLALKQVATAVPWARRGRGGRQYPHRRSIMQAVAVAPDLRDPRHHDRLPRRAPLLQVGGDRNTTSPWAQARSERQELPGGRELLQGDRGLRRQQHTLIRRRWTCRPAPSPYPRRLQGRPPAQITVGFHSRSTDRMQNDWLADRGLAASTTRRTSRTSSSPGVQGPDPEPHHVQPHAEDDPDQ
jgi:hypothetical protein